jgi:hypothetical protein
VDFLVPSILFGIALLAVILLVILVTTETRTKRQNAVTPKVATPEKPSAAEVPPAAIATTPLVPIGNQQSSLSQDPFQDLSLEVRNAHQHIYNIEQKLDVLTTRIEHIERTYNGHIRIEEEQETLELPQTPEDLIEDYPTQLP